MRARLMLTLAATAAAMVCPPAIDAVRAEGLAALTGLVSSEAEGKMEGVVVTARRPGSIVQVSVTTDAEGRYSFPRDRLEPGEYTLSIRAVGYDLDSPAKATVANGKAATADIKLKTTRNLAGQRPLMAEHDGLTHLRASPAFGEFGRAVRRQVRNKKQAWFMI